MAGDQGNAKPLRLSRSWVRRSASRVQDLQKASEWSLHHESASPVIPPALIGAAEEPALPFGLAGSGVPALDLL